MYGDEQSCFMVAHEGSGLVTEAILAHCRRHLPHEKVPKYACLVESLPRSERGKILRDELRREWWTEASRTKD